MVCWHKIVESDWKQCSLVTSLTFDESQKMTPSPCKEIVSLVQAQLRSFSEHCSIGSQLTLSSSCNIGQNPNLTLQ
jgi:hypothetical protein